jgi:glycine/D-amino acid oxidase-like deaminating enzyme
MKITVVGSGFVGQTAAMRLLEKGLGEVVLIDIIEGKKPHPTRARSRRSSAPTTARIPPVATSSSSRPGSPASRG